MAKKVSFNKKKIMVVFATSFSSKMGAIKDLLVLLGKEKKAKEIHREYEKRKFFGPWGLDELAKLYQGYPLWKLEDLSFYYCQKKMLKGMKDFIKELKERGILVGALSSDPNFLMERLKKEAGLDFAFGSKLEFERGKATGFLKEKLTRYEKAEIVKKIKKKEGISRVITIARASVTHIPIFKQSEISLGFDPAFRKDSLRIIEQLRKLLF